MADKLTSININDFSTGLVQQITVMMIGLLFPHQWQQQLPC